MSSVSGDLLVGIVSSTGAKKPVGAARILSLVTDLTISLCACSTNLRSLRCSQTALLNVVEIVAVVAGITTLLRNNKSGRSAV